MNDKSKSIFWSSDSWNLYVVWSSSRPTVLDIRQSWDYLTLKNLERVARNFSNYKRRFGKFREGEFDIQFSNDCQLCSNPTLQSQISSTLYTGMCNGRVSWRWSWETAFIIDTICWLFVRQQSTNTICRGILRYLARYLQSRGVLSPCRVSVGWERGWNIANF